MMDQIVFPRPDQSLHFWVLPNVAVHTDALSAALSRLECEIQVTVVSSEAGLNDRLSANPDLIFTDGSLSGTDAQQIFGRMDTDHSDIPIILIIDPDQAASIDEDLYAEASGWVYSDRLELLGAVVKRALKHRQIQAGWQNSPREGRFTGFDSINRNFIDHKAKENILARYQLLFNHSRDLILFVRFTDGRILEANSAAEGAYGYTHTELLGLTISDLRAPETLGFVQQQMQQAQREGITFETLHRRRNGQVFPVEVSSLGADFDGEQINMSIIRDITRRKEVQAALEDSEQKNRAFIEQNPEGVVLLDEQGTIVEWNKCQELSTGVPASEAIGKPLWEIQVRLVPTEKRNLLGDQALKEIFIGKCRSALVDRVDRPFDVTIQKPNGEQAIIRQTIFPIKTTTGYRLGTISYDNTQQYRAEAALRESEERYRLIVENSSAGIVVHVDNKIIFGNKAATRMIGAVDPNEVLGRSIFDFIHPDEREMISLLIQNAFLSPTQPAIPTPINVEERLVRLDGKVITVEASAIVINYDGKPGLMVMMNDITERKEAEEALRASEAKYRTLVENIPLRIFTKDRDSVFVSCNEKFANDLGLSVDEITGRTDFDFYTDDLAKHYQADDRRIVETGKTESIEEKYIIGGQEQWVQTIKTPLMDPNGAITGILGIFSDITERKRAEAQLRYQAELLSAVKDAVIATNETLHITSWNPGAEAIYGWKADEVIGRWLPDVLKTEYQEGSQIGAQNRVLSMGDYHGEVIHYCKDGSQIFIDSSVRLIRDEAGVATGFVGVNRNITDRKVAENELRQSEQRLEYYIEKTPFAVIEWDTELQVSKWNPAAERIFGYTAEEAVGRHMRFIIPDKVRSAIDRLWVRLFSTRESIANTNENVTKDGRTIVCRWENTPLTTPDGEVISIASMAQDITEQVQAERDLRQYRDHLEELVNERTAKLEESEASLRKYADEISDLYNNAPVGYHSLDQAGCFLRINDTELKWLGYTRDEIVGKNFRELMTAESIALFDMKFVELKNRGYVYEEELEILRKDGSVLPVVVNASAIIRADGQFVMSRSTVYDNTERKRTEAALRESAQAAEQANRAKSAFLANMSHEIRTPMNAILGFTQLILRDPELSGTQRGHLETIQRSGEHLLALINDVLEMSKIEAERVRLNESTFDLPGLIGELDRLFRVRTEAKGLALVVAPAADLPRYVVGDEAKLSQIFINLLGNAVKFTPAGQISWQLSWEALGAGGQLHAQVSDTGVGIAAEELGGLFKAFGQTTSGLQEGSGTGLGLAISARYAQLMGGELQVSSQVGVGSCFTVRVGLRSGVAGDVRPKPNPRRVLGVQGAGGQRVLVVDDQAENRELMRGLLGGMGFAIREARDGEEALAVYAAWGPQLILLDMRMPRLDGYGVLRQIRAQEPERRTRVVAVTASAFAEDQQRILELGADGYIRKPFTEQDLFDILGRLLKIEFIYDDNPPSEKKVDANEDEAWLKDWFAQQPAEWVRELRQAVLTANLDHLFDLIDRVDPEACPHIDLLHRYARSYQYDALLRLLSLRMTPDDHEPD